MSLYHKDCLEGLNSRTRCEDWGTEGHDPTVCPTCKAAQQARLGLTDLQVSEPCGEVQSTRCPQAEC
jgi:hypothetical protein